MVKVFDSIGGAFGYATKNTFKNPGVWFLVTIVAILEFIAGFIGLLYLGLGILINIFGNALSATIKTLLSQTPGLSDVMETILDIFLPLENTGTLIAIGIIGLLVFLLFFFFLGGLQVKIFAGQDVSFSGFFGTVGRGFQLCILSIIYDIVVIAMMVGVGFAVFAGSNLVSPINDLSGLLVALGIWSIIVVVLALFFAIFKYPALMNFARKGKFAAAFHFKEIGGLIGATKWYMILLGVVLNTIIIILICIVLGLICMGLGLIPGIAGAILSLIVMSLGSVFIFYLWSSYYAKLIENKA